MKGWSILHGLNKRVQRQVYDQEENSTLNTSLKSATNSNTIELEIRTCYEFISVSLICKFLYYVRIRQVHLLEKFLDIDTVILTRYIRIFSSDWKLSSYFYFNFIVMYRFDRRHSIDDVPIINFCDILSSHFLLQILEDRVFEFHLISS